MNAHVRARDDRSKVGGDGWRGDEAVRAPPVGRLVDAFDRVVGHDGPARRRRDADREGSLEVGLIEARKEPVRLERLEVGVDVDLAVDRIDEAVEPVAVAVVGVLVDHPHARVRRQELPGQDDPGTRTIRPVHRGAIDLETLDGPAPEVEEQVVRAADREGQAGLATVGRLLGGQCQREVVGDGADTSGTPGCLVPGQDVAGGRRGIGSCGWHGRWHSLVGHARRARGFDPLVRRLPARRPGRHA